MLPKLSIDSSSADFINPPTRCLPLCLDQAMRSLLLKELPMLDDIDIAPRQMGDQSHGHAFLKSVDCINVEFINGNYNKKKITNALIRPFKQLLQ
jgi:hypothetical protein